MNSSDGISSEVLSLPTGGATVQSIGDTFSPNLFTGTGSYNVPLWFPKGPGGMQPKLQLVYTTSQGNGPFGMGWTLPTVVINRRSDNGIPSYDDTADTFLLNGREIVKTANNEYRNLQEANFERILRLDDGWEIQSTRGHRYFLGASSASRIEDDSTGTSRIYAWHLEKECDLLGNEIKYKWRRDEGQLYLESIAYGPYAVIFKYEDRQDVLTNNRRGFLVRTALRCKGIEYRLINDSDPLFRRYTFIYEEDADSLLTLLKEITFSGHCEGESAHAPPLNFEYEEFKLQHRYKPMVSSVGLPPLGSTQDPCFELVDMEAQGLPGVLQIDGPVHRFWPNQGDGSWGRPRNVPNLPSDFDLSKPGVAFADIDSNCLVDLIDLSRGRLDQFPNEPGKGWQKRMPIKKAPTIDPSDPNVRLVDLDGNGRTDVVRSSDSAFYIYYNLGGSTWSEPKKIPRIRDRKRFPDVSLSDRRVRFANLTGDGLLSIVLVKGGRIDYWPNLGMGRFGSRVTLAISPSLTASFDPQRLFLLDVNSDGITDVVYVEHDRVKVWLNQAGTKLKYLGEIRHTPRTDGRNVRIADMDGHGTQGLVWSYPTVRRNARNYKYLAFTGETKPYVMTEIRNGIGLATKIGYQTSIQAAINARTLGNSWESHLPFPLLIINSIIKKDLVAGVETSQKINYFDPYYDGRKREFCGFRRVETIEEGNDEVPSLKTITFFHQGIDDPDQGDVEQSQRSLRGRIELTEKWELDKEGNESKLFSRESEYYDIRKLAESLSGQSVEVVYPKLTRVEVFEGSDQPVISEREFTYDDYGNVIAKKERWDNGGEKETSTAAYKYTVNKENWLLNLPLEHQIFNSEGELLRFSRYYYDGDGFRSLPFKSVTHGKLTCIKIFVLSDSLVAQVYGADHPNFRQFGYFRMRAPNGKRGWGIYNQRQCYDAFGNSIKIKDALGNVGSFEYDDLGIFKKAAVNTLGHRYEAEVDLRAGSITKIRDPNGNETSYGFDPLGRLTKVIKPGDSEAYPTQSIEYLEGSFEGETIPTGKSIRLRRIKGIDKTVDTVEYVDGRGQAWQTRSSAEDGKVIVNGWHRFNCRGWEAERTIPFFSTGFDYKPDEGMTEAHPIYFKHDGLGRLLETRTSDKNLSRTVYSKDHITQFDASDLDERDEDFARSHFDTPRIGYFDAKGRLVAVSEHKTRDTSIRTSYGWSTQGELLSIKDARGVTIATYTYDLLGRKIHINHKDAGVREAVYDANGDLAISIDAVGREVNIKYDKIRRKQKVYVADNLEENYVYDSGSGSNLIGRLAKVEDLAGEMTFSYTLRGFPAYQNRRIESLDGVKQYETLFEYDSSDTLTQITRPDGSSIEYTYDDRGLVNAVPGAVDKIRRNVLGQIIECQLANGVIETYKFDPTTNFMTDIQVDVPNKSLSHVHLHYKTLDAMGNPISIEDKIMSANHTTYSRDYTYDALSRLKDAKATINGAETNHRYEYDDAGNFMFNSEFSSDQLYLLDNESNQIGGTIQNGHKNVLFSYDLNGNLVTSPERECEFDARGRLTKVNTGSDIQIEYTYSFTGARIRKLVTLGNGTKRESLYINAAFEQHDGKDRSFILLEGQRIAEDHQNDKRFYWHRNHVGSVILVTDDEGERVCEQKYWPFGTLVCQQGVPPTSHGFIGCDMDEDSGLIYCATRFYDPKIGRFISPDPLFLFSPEKGLIFPVNLNLYAYAGNNPISNTDPLGAFFWFIAGALFISAAPAANAAIFFGTAGPLTIFTGGLVTSVGGILGGAVSFGIAVGQTGKDIWDLSWEEFASLDDEFFFGVVIGAATLTLACVGGVALGGIGLAQGFTSIGYGIGITTEGGAVLASGFTSAFTGGVMSAGSRAIQAYSATEHKDWGRILEAAALGFLEGAATGFLGGVASGLSSVALPAAAKALESIHIQKEIIDLFNVGAPTSQGVVTSMVWGQIKSTASPFLPEPAPTLIDVGSSFFKPLDKMLEWSVKFDYATPNLPT